MRTPTRISLIVVAAVVLAVVFTTVVSIVKGAPPGHVWSSAFLEALVLGTIAWCSTYFAARSTSFAVLSNAFTLCLASLYAALATLLTFPIKTHAILVDGSSPQPATPLLGTPAFLAGFIFALVFLPMIATRLVAAVARRGKPDGV